MKILVTGATGFLGTAVVERLLAHGHRDIRCFVRPRSRRERLSTVVQRFPEASLEYITGTLTSLSDVKRAVEGVDVVLHLAAALKGSAVDMFLHTVVGSRNLLEAMVACDSRARVVLVSSFGVYGVAQMARGAVVNEQTPLEPHPELRDVYSYAKLRQEQLFWEYAQKHKIELVVARPGVIYGPNGGHMSSRVGLNVFGIFAHLGGRNLLPLTYVDNCAEALVVLSTAPHAAGRAFNINDDNLPTSAGYLRRYIRDVKRMRTIRVPYFALMWLTRALEKYHRYSQGQLPAIFTRYKVATTWGGSRFDNSNLKSSGWKQLVPTEEALQRTFAAFRKQLNVNEKALV